MLVSEKKQGLITQWASQVAQQQRMHLPMRRREFNPWVGKIPWRLKWQPTPVFLPGKPHGQRSLAGYSPWDLKELDTTEQLTHTFTYFLKLSIFEIHKPR